MKRLLIALGVLAVLTAGIVCLYLNFSSGYEDKTQESTQAEYETVPVLYDGCNLNDEQHEIVRTEVKRVHKEAKDLINKHRDELIELCRYSLENYDDDWNGIITDGASQELIDWFDEHHYVREHTKNGMILLNYCEEIDIYGPWHENKYLILYSEEPFRQFDSTEFYGDARFVESVGENLYFVICGCNSYCYLYDYEAYNEELNALYEAEKQALTEVSQ